jgi:hypothetical protein
LRSGARSRHSLAAKLLFALLVAATVGAFFVTTRLKRATPVVENLSFDSHLSPNGDGRHDVTDISFRTKRPDEVTVSILDDQGEDVRAIATDRSLGKGRHRFRWNGRTSGGRVAPDGTYRVRIGLRHQGRSVTPRRKIFVDTKPPTPTIRSVSPAFISPGGGGARSRATLAFDGPRRSVPTLMVYRMDTLKPRLVAERRGIAGTGKLSWNGRVGLPRHERSAAPGDYALMVRIEDAAGNIGPRQLPPVRGRVPGHPGVVVRYISAVAPSAPVAAGGIASFSVQSDGRRYRWSVRRIGSGRTLEHGFSRSAVLHVRAPKTRSGVFLLHLQVGSHRYATPFAVRARARRNLLIILPATTWEARNRLDADRDGFPDVLPEQRTVSLGRPFLGRGLPPRFSSEVAPLLQYLDSSSRPYDVTTDRALARSGSRLPARYRRVLFAGAPRFFTPQVGRLMRSYVESGGRLCWFGTDGFTEGVALGAKSLTLSGRRARPTRNVFGESLVADHSGGALTVLGDRIRFFAGVSSLGSFSTLERSQALPSAARLLASAGDRPGEPALVVYRLGRGVVVRAGAGGVPPAARGSPEITPIMRKLWTLLLR